MDDEEFLTLMGESPHFAKDCMDLLRLALAEAPTWPGGSSFAIVRDDHYYTVTVRRMPEFDDYPDLTI